MIQSVEISNFQSHKHTIIEMVSGTNVIIGESDAGKSAVFRAINWVLSNRPLGDSFRSEWGGETKVTLRTSSHSEVSRIRTDKYNAYVVNGTELAAFGSETPSEVFEALNIDPCNVQSQMDPPFLLSSSPGEVAQMLNRAASIDDIDRTIGGLKKSYQRINREMNYNKEQLAKHETRLAKYTYLEDLEQIVQNAENALQAKEQVQNNIKYISDLITHSRQLMRKLKASEYVHRAGSLVDEARSLNETYQSQYNIYIQLQQTIADLASIQGGIRKTNGAEQVYPIVKQAEQSQSFLRDVRNGYTALKELVDRVKELSEKMDGVDSDLIDLESEYEESAPEQCPLCGNVMKKGE